MLNLVIDAMGFENDPIECINACKEFIIKNKDVSLLLVGDLEKYKNEFNHPNLTYKQTKDFVSQDDTIMSFRRKENTSIQICADLLKENKVDGMLSAANSSIFVFCLYSTIGTFRNFDKIAFMPKIPKVNGFFNMLDVGASIDVSVNDLYNFAIAANEFALQYKTNPVIKILNIGTEEHKGTNLQIEANKLFKKSDTFNYQGFIEPKVLLDSDADIVVTDGFSGNIALKALEGTAKVISKELKTEFKKKKNLFPALLSRKILRKVGEKFDYKNNAGAFVVGIKKPVVKTHGSADKQQFLSSLSMLYDVVKNKVVDKIEMKINNLMDNTND